MKCPSCGKEVVIATDLCPWCGYKYSFDGSIPPKEPVYEPGEEEQREDRRRDRGDTASERWTRAGSFTGSGQEGRRERRVRDEPRADTAARGMRWYSIAINIILPLTFVYYLYQGITSLASFFTTMSLGDFLWYYRYNPTLSIAQVVTAIVYIIFAVLAMLASKQLKRYEWRGVMLYLAVIMLPPCVDLVYQVLWMTYFDYYYGAFTLTLEFLASVIYAVVTAIYFARRRGKFS